MRGEAPTVREALPVYIIEAPKTERVPPGYRQTEVGVIPEDWEIVSLSELLDFRNGANADKSAYGQGTPFINVLEVITRTHLRASDILGRVTLPSLLVDSYAVRRGDILFNRTSETQEEVGLASVYLGGGTVIFGGFVIRGRVRGAAIDDVYSGYAFRSSVVRSQIISKGQGAVRANIGQQELSRVLAPIPPPSEQRAIAAALSDVDALIAALDKLIAKKRAVKTAAMQLLLTGKQRLPGFSVEWEVKRLGDVVERIVGGGTPSRANPAYWGGEIPWVTVKDFTTFNPRHTQEAITEEGLKHSASNLIPKGIVITSTRMAVGKAVIYEVDVSINQDLKAIFPKQNVDSQFLYFWFDYHAATLEGLGSGSTVKGISLQDLRNVEFRKAPLAEQRAIAAVLSDMDAEISALEGRREKTLQVKQGMMQELLTGRTRLV